MSDVAQRIKDCFAIDNIFKIPTLAQYRISGRIGTGSIKEVREILLSFLKFNGELGKDDLIKDSLIVE